MSRTADLHLFGSPGVRLAGEAVSLHRKPLALLAYLAVTGERVGRSVMAELLWPGSAPRQAGVNLRKAIWSVHEAIGAEALAVDPAGDLSIGTDLSCDVQRFSRRRAEVLAHGHPPPGVCRACAQPLRDALRLTRGEFMEGFGLPDSADFDDWQRMHAERLRRERADLLDRLAGYHRATGDLETARALAQRRLGLDPLHEGARRQLMSLCVWTGDRSESLRQYAELESLLQAELGVEPEAETRLLYEAIRESRLLPPPDRLLPEPGRTDEPEGTDDHGSGREDRAAPSGRSGRRSDRSPASIGRQDASAPAGFPERQPARPSPERATSSRLLDRIEVADAESAPAATALESRGLPRPMARLLATVLDPGVTVRLDLQQARQIAAFQPLDLLTYRLGRIAAWARPGQRLDERFVSMRLLLDRGETAREGRWQALGDDGRAEHRDEAPGPGRYAALTEVLDARTEPALVLLGPPGAGKSTLLRHLELDLSASAIRGERRTVSFYLSLSSYRSEVEGVPPPDPMDWLVEAWRARYPRLPQLESLIEEGRLLLLLDGLNEMPHTTSAEYHRLVERWRVFLLHRLLERPGLRAIFACRSLDYSAPLSSPELRVPQIRVEALDDDRMRAFLKAYRPEQAEALWSALEAADSLTFFRRPYLLRLLLSESKDPAAPLADRAALFTRIVRRALQRELERGNPDLGPGGLIDQRDCRRILLSAWPGPHALPDRSPLIPALEDLARDMQASRPASGGAQVRLTYARSLELIDHPQAERILPAGLALDLLEEDLAADELGFQHQLLQEYFAGRRLVREPELELARSTWRAEAVEPVLQVLLESLPASERLPGLPTTGWEEAVMLAAAMHPRPEEFLERLMPLNLGLAGRCALELGERCPDRALEGLRRALLERSRDPRSDLRARIEAGLVLGRLGSPDLEPQRGPQGRYIEPPWADIAAGHYPIGSDGPIDYLGSALDHSLPRHRVRLEAFCIGCHAVTNAEWARFMEAGGYEDERWWDSRAGRAWRRGDGNAEGQRAAVRYWWRRFRAEPQIIDRQHESGEFDTQKYALWRSRIQMNQAQLEAHLRERYPDAPIDQPLHWRDEDFDNPRQPVVGICWMEARAYCRWLSAQTGRSCRLPTELQWEAAARGRQGRLYAGSPEFLPELGNTMELQIRRTTPVGVFPAGDTPEGASDLVGNTWDWTSSAWGPEVMEPAYRYPYDPGDGREDPESAENVYRVVRGGAWFNGRISVRSDYRGRDHAFDRTSQHGLRLVTVDRPER